MRLDKHPADPIKRFRVAAANPNQPEERPAFDLQPLVSQNQQVSDHTRKKVRRAAWALLLVAGLMFTTSSIAIYMSFVSGTDMSVWIWQKAKVLSSNESFQKYIQDHIDAAQNRDRTIEQVFNAMFAGLSLFLNAFIAIAGYRMLACKNYAICIAGSIVAMIFNGALCAGLPVGIWALIILIQPDVKSAFDEKALESNRKV
jgi:hypothetical protein